MFKSNYIGLRLVIMSFLIMGMSCVKAMSQDQQVIFLVRHAEKMTDTKDDPDLNIIGKERAERLAKMLAVADIEKIYSTNYIRTKETGLALSRMISREIELYAPNDKNEIKRMLEESKGANMLIIGHSNTIPGIVNRLINKDKFKDLDDSEYDKLFVVTRCGDKAQATVLTY